MRLIRRAAPGASRPRRLLPVAAVALLLAVLAGPQLTFAHAELDGAEPAPASAMAQAPRQLRLTFSEPLDGSFSRVQILNSRSERVDRGDSRVSPDDAQVLTVSLVDRLPDGVYTVAWRSLSTFDGHPANGSYPLTIGGAATLSDAAAQTVSADYRFSPETAVARWWLFLGASVLFGTLLAWRVVFAPLLRGEDALKARLAAAARLRRLAVLAGVVLVLGVLYGAVAQAAVAGDAPLWGSFGEPLQGVLTRGRFASIWWPRLGLSLAALALVAWRGVDGWAGELGIAALACVLLTSSLTSHAAAVPTGTYLTVAADWLHFMGAAVWIGGLAALVVALPIARQAHETIGERVLARAVGRFSNVALPAVAVLALTGAFQAWVQVGSFEALVQTAYGQSLTVKIGLTALMLACAAVNLVVLRPRLGGLSLNPTASTAVARLARLLSRTTRAELALGVGVLVAAAVLTGLAPGRDELARQIGTQAGPVDRRVDADGLAARVRIAPATVGPNRFAVALPGTDPASVERVQLTLTYLDADLGSQPVVLQPAADAPGTWEATSSYVAQPGRWQAELLVRRSGQDDARATLPFGAEPPGATGTPRPTSNYPRLPSLPSGVVSALGSMGPGFGGVLVLFLLTYWFTVRGGSAEPHRPAPASIGTRGGSQPVRRRRRR